MIITVIMTVGFLKIYVDIQRAVDNGVEKSKVNVLLIDSAINTTVLQVDMFCECFIAKRKE